MMNVLAVLDECATSTSTAVFDVLDSVKPMIVETLPPADVKPPIEVNEVPIFLCVNVLNKLAIFYPNAIANANEPSPAVSAVVLTSLIAPEMLLLDEPTNHLDAETIAWLQQHLIDYQGTILIVTHDRYFLDDITGWILELDRGRGIPYEGNYSS